MASCASSTSYVDAYRPIPKQPQSIVKEAKRGVAPLPKADWMPDECKTVPAGVKALDMPVWQDRCKAKVLFTQQRRELLRKQRALSGAVQHNDNVAQQYNKKVAP